MSIFATIAFKQASGAVSAKKDLEIVISYIKSRQMDDLNRKRFNQKTGANLDFPGDDISDQAQNIINNVVNNISEIDRHTANQKEIAARTKKSPLSPDENYALEISALKTIKEAGLQRRLTTDEINTLKQATQYISMLYPDQVADYKRRGNNRSR